MSGPADRDLSGIIDHTVRQWGKAQAKTYVSQIRETIAKLAEAPNLVADEVIDGMIFKRRRSGHHLVYAHVAGPRLIVARILHERMDATIQFN